MKRKLERWSEWWVAQPSARRWKVGLLVVILLTGTFLRIYQFPAYPAGLNQDEISSAYEAYSLATTGKDRWGYSWPAYFLGWGSGQNVLLSYLSIPVVALFGLTPLSVRLVPLVIGILTMPLLFWVVRRYLNTTTAMVATAILAVCPWHVLLSRWGLESNLLPFFLLLGVGSVGYALTAPKKHRWVITLSLLPFAISLYAYGIAAPVVPLLAGGLLAFSWRQVIKQWRWWLASCLLALLVALPFILFVLQNYVLHHPLGSETNSFISIPMLEESRLSQVRSETGDPVFNLMFIVGGFNDHTVYNVVGNFLPLPLGVLLLALGGIVITLADAVHVRLRKVSPFLIWLLASSVLFSVVALNVNQANAMFIPLIVLAAIGLVRSTEAIPQVALRRGIMIAVLGYIVAAGFTVYVAYFGPANAQALATNYHPSLKKAFSTLQQENARGVPVFVSSTVPLSYVQTLFYTNTLPTLFQSYEPVPNNPDFTGYYFAKNRLPAGKDYAYLIHASDIFICRGQAHTVWQQDDWLVGMCRALQK